MAAVPAAGSAVAAALRASGEIMLNANDSALIEQAIVTAEKGTRSEIMICVLRASSVDRGIAGIVAMMAAGLVLALLPGFQPEADIWLQSGLSAAIGLAVFLLVDRFDLGLKLLPGSLTARHSRRAARTVFLDHDLDSTPERNAVLLFVSHAERYVEILADRGLAAEVPQERWAKVIAAFRETARRKGVAHAAADAVVHIGAICAEKFPAVADNPDLRPNRPITE